MNELVVVTTKTIAKILIQLESNQDMGKKTVDVQMWVSPEIYQKMKKAADEVDIGVSTWARMVIVGALREEPSNSTRSTPGPSIREGTQDGKE